MTTENFERPASASPTTVTVLVAGLAVDDGQAARAVIGERRTYLLTFHEVRTIFIDSGLYGEARWVDAHVSEPPDDDVSRTFWPTKLVGRGWTAMWFADRPLHGAVRLHGYLQVAISFDSTTLVRGLVTAVRGNWADLELTDQPREVDD